MGSQRKRAGLSVLTITFCGLLSAAWGSAALAQATDLTCNECVQTPDLAPNAVNNSKIANAAVNAAKLAANAVTVAKVANNSVTAAKIATAAVTSAKIGPNAVRTSKIANAAVTAAKIAPGAVNVTKLADGAVTAAKLAPGAVFANTVIVSPVGPAATDNCQELIGALASITNASANNPYLLVIEPGLYDCGAKSVILKSFVDVEGAGPGATRLQSASSGDFMILASNIILRGFSIERTAPSGSASALAGNAVTDVLLTNLHFQSNGTGTAVDNRGIALINGSQATLRDLVSLADGGSGETSAIFLNASTADMTNVEARGSNGGTGNQGLNASNSGAATARNSIFAGTGANSASVWAGDVAIATSQIIGAPLGGPLCVGAYNSAFAPLDGNCVVP